MAPLPWLSPSVWWSMCLFRSSVHQVLRFWNLMIDEGTESVETIMRSWFPSADSLSSGHIMELVSWTLYNVPFKDTHAKQRRVVERVALRCRGLMRKSIVTEAHDDSCCNMMHTREPLAPAWKPLGFYLLVQFFGAMAHGILRFCGFELRTEGDLEYYYHTGRNEISAREAQLPLVILHGVGGFPPLMFLMLRLVRARPDTPLIVPLFPHCAMLVPPFNPPPLASNSSLVKGIHAIVSQHSPRSCPPRAAFMGHSLGTALLASVLKTYPTLVATAMFVDPICFLLYKTVRAWALLASCCMRCARAMCRRCHTRRLCVRAAACL